MNFGLNWFNSSLNEPNWLGYCMTSPNLYLNPSMPSFSNGNNKIQVNSFKGWENRNKREVSFIASTKST